ncbi:hypothetical protein Amsp01_044790 [Amycolatopsis sp. NBRC 101858]|uniref:hypothetical protein n=1 Tax=Amycolatopsis sp. NBRC 101858 TaxID=3032200 RepID=UPI0024A296AF|nr:hypothetical protein [Amycolatopsis sp. NBRC 101858]GLY38455.1 hypothetical protein Amsp01_044790 [Amycolatopsis sp. NBRC 101858]
MSRGWQHTSVVCSLEKPAWWGRQKWVWSWYEPTKNGPALVQPQPENEMDLLNILGRQGWELVTITVLPAKSFGNEGDPGSEVPPQLTWYFKRPIE